MAWIESHQALEKHPKILQLSTIMGWTLNETIGVMHRFWWWCLDYAPTGDLRPIDPITLGKALALSDVDCKNFMPALIETHLVCRLTRTRLPWRVHDWVEYAGKYLRDTKFRRAPEKYTQVIELYKQPCLPCQPTVSRLSADNPTTVSRKSAVPTYLPTNLPKRRSVDTVDNGDRHTEGDGLTGMTGIQDMVVGLAKKAGFEL